MILFLDFDGCFTADPDFWLQFAIRAGIFGHEVVTVTHRRDTLENRRAIRDTGVNWPVVFAYDMPKKFAAIEAGYDVEGAVWVDDNPTGIGDGTECQPTTQSVFEIELRNAHKVLTDSNLRMNEFAELITRLETVLGGPA